MLDLSTLQPAIDAVRFKADLIRKTLDAAAPMAKWIPVVGAYVGQAQVLIDSLGDAIDSLDDSLKAALNKAP